MAQRFHIEAQLLEGVLHVLEDAGAVEAVGKKPPHQELEREVIDALGVLLGDAPPCVAIIRSMMMLCTALEVASHQSRFEAVCASRARLNLR